MNLGLRSKTALVSGSTAGIGLRHCRALAAEGAKGSSSMAAPKLAWMPLSISFANA